MNKFDSIITLAKDIQSQICKNEEEWKKYLNTAARLYKYTYDEQILIYAQRPDATACASIEIWNKKMNCWVNRGAKGIALIDKKYDNLRLKYVFDVSDVHKHKDTGRTPYIWEMSEDYKNKIITGLEKIYGDTDDSLTFEERIIQLTKAIVNENYADYIGILDSLRYNSFIEELDLISIEVMFKNIVSSSMAYSILYSSGADTNKYKELLNFDGIYNFNTVETLSQIGTAVSIHNKTLLMEIGRIIGEYEKANIKVEKDQKSKVNITEYKGEKNEHNISKQRGLPDSEINNGRSTRTIDREIRSVEEKILNGESKQPISEHVINELFEQSFDQDKSRSNRENRPTDKSNENRTEYQRRIEVEQPNDMGSENEQYTNVSRGNSSEGTYLQLTLFPTVQQQIEAIEIGESLRSPISIVNNHEQEEKKYSYLEPRIEKDVPNEFIKYLLKNGYGCDKQKVYGLYLNENDPIIRAKSLKKIYHIGGQTGFSKSFDGYIFHSYHTLSKKGITFKWKSNEGENQCTLSWNRIQKEIKKLINENDYLTSNIQTNVDTTKMNIDVKENKSTDTKKESVLDLEIMSNEQHTYHSPNTVSETIPITLPESLENYDFRDYKPNYHNDRDKFNCNVEAIKTLKTLDREMRPATESEKEILSRYVGWGGLPQAFDPNKNSWNDEYSLLKSILDDSEYKMARSSTLNAHYTPPEIIRCVYETIEGLGFRKGNILDPALGVGYFFGMLPDSMKGSKLYGVELDSISGRIAKHLYPNAKIEVTGFEKTTFKDGSFDIGIGNIPFGNYRVSDKKYDNLNFMIHDYFFAKTLDKVRAGGLIVFITSKGTLDKKNNAVRKYIAQRADLLGAVRLPNNAFLSNAGTEVTSDIIFLQKRDRLIEADPSWIHLGLNDDGIPLNEYYIDNPNMILGKMENISGPYGIESTCTPLPEDNMLEQLKNALQKIKGDLIQPSKEHDTEEEILDSIPADPEVNNFSYTVVNDEIYYRENSIMVHIDTTSNLSDRIRSLIEIRDCTRTLITYQLEEYSPDLIKDQQVKLNKVYDTFTNNYGLINNKTNLKAFRDDSSYFLLCSLEILNEDGTLNRKADIFTKRTIKQREFVTSVETASDALTLSLSQKARIDFDYMSSLLNNRPSQEDIIKSLNGIIFKNPITKSWETSDEYLSGNVRKKLNIASDYAKSDPTYLINVQFLEKVQPKDLEASEIDVRLGATWINQDIIKQFMFELLKTPKYLSNYGSVDVLYSSVTGTWSVKGKSADNNNVIANVTYGTNRINAYKILEDTLNLKDIRIFDIIRDLDGKEHRELNKKETILAQQKQDLIKEAFRDWIFKTPERREALCNKYNDLFNSVRPREFDGSHLTLYGMNNEISLRTHQLNVIARIIYGKNNTLAAHVVGAGKTFAMIAAAMESKRLGLSQKSIFVVPNHLIEQWSSDFLKLYPGANILASTKRDFEPANRKKFCSRIATGDYDAVIIGHSQFEKIPLSKERQELTINNQIEEITNSITELKANNGERYTIKQMEKTKKSLEARLVKLNDTSRKDAVVTFEELGVDRLFVDEAHSYKNLFLYTKMRNVAGISQTEAQKSSDMFSKCQYIDELTGGKGIIFATGTPVSNSMTELYTMMRYLQFNTLKDMNLSHFDSWASSFGETVTAIELSPEGTGYRSKTRFSKFYNLPELINIFKEVADIQTSDMLKLPIPVAKYENIVLKPSDTQKEIVKSLAERADKVRNKLVEPNIDNMLKITNDGRKLALDQRLINPLLTDFEGNKVNECTKNVYEIWDKTTTQKSTQLIFCDLSTPKGDENFNVYSDIKKKLIEKGIPQDEIAFIHDANTDLKKAELFSKVRKGSVRILIGSTSKMGAGTNVQNKLIALHHIDVPWKPSDIEQQEGRILRQGNENKEVNIFKYVTEGTFDAYSWQLIENKQKFISQIMTSKSPVRSCEDIDEATLSYAEVKALATGNPYIKEKMDLDIQVAKLKLLKANYLSQKYNLEDNIAKHYPKEIQKNIELINGMNADIELFNKHISNDFSIVLKDITYIDKKDAGTKIIEICKDLNKDIETLSIGSYYGFSIKVRFEPFGHKFILSLSNALDHNIDLGPDPIGNLTRIDHCLINMKEIYSKYQDNLESLYNQLEDAKEEVKKSFIQEEELNTKLARLNKLNSLLSLDNSSVSEPINKQAIIDDLEKYGFNKQSSLVEKILNLSKEMGKTKSIKEIKELSKNRNPDPKFDNLIKDIMNDIKLQERQNIKLNLQPEI